MPEPYRRTPRTAGQHPRQNRESHINLGLIGRGLYLQAEDRGRFYIDQRETIKGITTSEDGSASPRDIDSQKENAHETGLSLPVGNVAPPDGVRAPSTVHHKSPWKTFLKKGMNSNLTNP